MRNGIALRISRAECVRRTPRSAQQFFSGTRVAKAFVPAEELDAYAVAHPKDYLIRLDFIQEALRKPSWACAVAFTEGSKGLLVCKKTAGKSVLLLLEKENDEIFLRLNGLYEPRILWEEPNEDNDQNAE